MPRVNEFYGDQDKTWTAEEWKAEVERLRAIADKGWAEVERLRAEQDNAGFIPWRLAQDSIDELTAEVERLRKDKAEMAAQWYEQEAEVERLRAALRQALAELGIGGYDSKLGVASAVNTLRAALAKGEV